MKQGYSSVVLIINVVQMEHLLKWDGTPEGVLPLSVFRRKYAYKYEGFTLFEDFPLSAFGFKTVFVPDDNAEFIFRAMSMVKTFCNETPTFSSIENQLERYRGIFKTVPYKSHPIYFLSHFESDHIQSNVITFQKPFSPS